MSETLSSRPYAVITGASSGIGMAFARQLAAKGCNLLLTARRRNRLESLKTELEEKYDISAEVLPADLTKLDDILKLEEKIKEISELLYMINDAGFIINGNHPEKSTDMIMVHNTAMLRFCQAALVPMTKNNKGYIINVASSAGFLAVATIADYCATKSFIITYSRCLQCDCSKTNIKIQALCPGFVRTEIFKTASMLGNPYEKYVLNFFGMLPERVVKKSLSQIHRCFFRPVIFIPSIFYKILVPFAACYLLMPLRKLLTAGRMR
ncbi:MAG: SDR family NAD(P)-dependent oxidoreductase [Planctomycetia bacterium]|nr:SDR family NAD(P)-dependent oxidoreductase [Planctomycetia bacterium]